MVGGIVPHVPTQPYVYDHSGDEFDGSDGDAAQEAAYHEGDLPGQALMKSGQQCEAEASGDKHGPVGVMAPG